MEIAAISGLYSDFLPQSKQQFEFDIAMPWKETSEPKYCFEADSTGPKVV